MRENMGLYRGKRTGDGEWVEGFYVHLYDHKGNESHRIYPGYAETDCGDYYPDWFEVDPETVGPFVGRCDSNGTTIFDGDIVKIVDGTGCVEPIVGVIQFENCGFFFKFGKSGKTLFGSWSRECYVIGNIHDNPELLEVK